MHLAPVPSTPLPVLPQAVIVADDPRCASLAAEVLMAAGFTVAATGGPTTGRAIAARGLIVAASRGHRLGAPGGDPSGVRAARRGLDDRRDAG